MTRFKVHSCHETTVPVPANFGGVEVVGALPVVIVELVGTEPYQRSFTHVEPVETAEKLAAARAKFRPDVVVEITLSTGEQE